MKVHGDAPNKCSQIILTEADTKYTEQNPHVHRSIRHKPLYLNPEGQNQLNNRFPEGAAGQGGPSQSRSHPSPGFGDRFGILEGAWARVVGNPEHATMEYESWGFPVSGLGFRA